ncbi:MAG: hypothetical protein EBT73_06855 [Actinobacteria bacterium]|nr:hypothetical protein [Actinomycetota bacterium]
MVFFVFTFRTGEISVGYGKLLRGVYAAISLMGAGFGIAFGAVLGREIAAVGLAALALAAFARRDTTLDVLAAVSGFVGVIIATLAVEHGDGVGSDMLWLVRLLVGAVFLGAVSDAMLLGHWYLVQPGMPRKLLNQLTNVVLAGVCRADRCARVVYSRSSARAQLFRRDGSDGVELSRDLDGLWHRPRGARAVDDLAEQSRRRS